MRDADKKREAARRWALSDAGKEWRRAYLAGRKDAVSERNKAYHAAHRDDLNRKRREMRAAIKENVDSAMAWSRQRMLRDAAARASRKGLPFTIGLEDIGAPLVCPVLGMPLNWLRTRHGPDSPSLDRIRNEVGYVPGNVWVISRRANTIKSDATPAELRAVADAIEGVREFPEAAR